MKVTKWSASQRAAFKRGFWKGMAAPLSIYSSAAFPVEAMPPEYRPIERRAAQPKSDWVKVGEQLRAAAEAERRQLEVMPQVRDNEAHHLIGG